jgi:flagellar biosynthesis/type III secretory pathway protein FliH
MNWFTEPARSTAAVATPWLPGGLAAGIGDVPREAPPPLAFDEGELARIAAAASLRARQDADAAHAADPATRHARALERLAEALEAARREQVHATSADLRRTIELAAALARTAAPAAGDAQALAERYADLLAGVDGPATLIVPPAAAAELRPLLADIAAAAGLAGGLELAADPALPEGAARVSWPGGWLEQDPAALAQRLAALLAAHAHAPHPPTDGADHADRPA